MVGQRLRGRDDKLPVHRSNCLCLTETLRGDEGSRGQRGEAGAGPVAVVVRGIGRGIAPHAAAVGADRWVEYRPHAGCAGRGSHRVVFHAAAAGGAPAGFLNRTPPKAGATVSARLPRHRAEPTTQAAPARGRDRAGAHHVRSVPGIADLDGRGMAGVPDGHRADRQRISRGLMA